MPVPASPRKIRWEKAHLEHPNANFQIYCVNGHSVGDLAMWQRLTPFEQDHMVCPFCSVGKPWLFRWEVD